MGMDEILGRIERETGVADLAALLAERLESADLHSLLLEVYRDGGAVDWTQKLLSNARERLVISGISGERLCSLVRD